MVFLRSRRNNEDVLLREQYNVVDYGGETYIEGLSDPGLRLIEGGPSGSIQPEVIHGIRVYDRPPFNSRIGFVQ
jgi:hypothetical protein